MLAIERTDEFCDPFMKKCVKIICRSISVRIWRYFALQKKYTQKKTR